ncbi:MAG: hypothetical protein M1829_003949 [Trizodia sp. TS-e1964]|nr:MAG: hypothetical protein M1829_003949 [Trizodia sp. TS-e1964]
MVWPFAANARLVCQFITLSKRLYPLSKRCRNSSRRSSVSPDSRHSLTADATIPLLFSGQDKVPNTREVLCYIRSTFDDDCVLDSIPLDAAGNPGAWHAWRTHRQKVKAELALHGLYPSELDSDEEAPEKLEEGDQSELASVSDAPTPGHHQSLAGGALMVNTRRPGEWSWEGVWEARVRKGVALSTADAVVFGGHGGGDELDTRAEFAETIWLQIHFLNMDRDALETVKENIKRSVEMDGVLG